MEEKFQFAIQVYAKDGTNCLGQVQVTPDFVPAREQVLLEALRRHARSPAILPAGPHSVEPIWSAERGQPFLDGFRTTIDTPDGMVSCELPVAYFAELATEASAEFVRSGQLKDGEQFRYQVCAFIRDQSAESPRSSRLIVEQLPQALPISELPLGELLGKSVPQGAADSRDLPVFIPRQVLKEAEQQALAAGKLEAGGILIGYLHRDYDLSQLFVKVTAQIPARQTHQEVARLTFTKDTWKAMTDALKLRGGTELYLGYWHSHPQGAWCENCPPEKRQRCPLMLGTGFFSDADRQLFRIGFSRAWNIAPVLSITDAGMVWSMWGWRLGQIERRGFYLYDSNSQTAPPPPSATLAGMNTGSNDAVYSIEI